MDLKISHGETVCLQFQYRRVEFTLLGGLGYLRTAFILYLLCTKFIQLDGEQTGLREDCYFVEYSLTPSRPSATTVCLNDKLNDYGSRGIIKD